MTSIITLRTIDLNIFPIEKTIFGVLAEQTGRRSRTNSFFNQLEKNFPSATEAIKAKRKEQWNI